jgi:hypothetical protein
MGEKISNEELDELIELSDKDDQGKVIIECKSHHINPLKEGSIVSHISVHDRLVWHPVG